MSGAPVPWAPITKPGVYYDLPDHVYHADPVPGGSLSQSGAKRLLPPSCPMLFRHERIHGRPDTAAFDFGHAAHRLVLGAGAELMGVDADDWRTKAAKDQRDAIRARGGVPLLLKELAIVEEMAAKLRDHPIAGPLLDPRNGTAEVSVFWQDERTGVWLRARFDHLPHPADGRLIIPDYKTAANSNPARFGKTAADLRYDIQDAWYRAAARAAGLGDDDAAFLFVVQEKTAPYVVSVIQLDSTARRIGEQDMHRAVEIYRDCTETGIWPAYTDDVAVASLPGWFVNTRESETW